MTEMLTAFFDGELKIGKTVLPCAVLEDGTRVLTSAGFMTAIGRPWKGSYKRTELPNFLAGSNLKPFIDNDLISVLPPIEYKGKSGGIKRGYKAELLPKVCEVYLKAREEGALLPSQMNTAKAAEVMVRALAHIGIIALVDEATGFQAIRDRNALEKILEMYISKELLSWAKRFPDDFYRELFRLRGWQWKGMHVNRPSFVGKITNDVIYERLAPGVLAKLKQITPRSEKGNTLHRYHQRLTPEIGQPDLDRHVAGVLALMRASSTWGGFKRAVQRAYPRPGDQHELPFDELN